jgi:hypothetical protein
MTSIVHRAAERHLGILYQGMPACRLSAAVRAQNLQLSHFPFSQGVFARFRTILCDKFHAAVYTKAYAKMHKRVRPQREEYAREIDGSLAR